MADVLVPFYGRKNQDGEAVFGDKWGGQCDSRVTRRNPPGAVLQ
jgi:hypothetical protein